MLLDSIDTRVELLRKEALKLQDERDLILTRIDLLKNTDLLSNLNATDHEEVGLQLSRINARLQVRTSVNHWLLNFQSFLAYSDCWSQRSHRSRQLANRLFEHNQHTHWWSHSLRWSDYQTSEMPRIPKRLFGWVPFLFGRDVNHHLSAVLRR